MTRYLKIGIVTLLALHFAMTSTILHHVILIERMMTPHHDTQKSNQPVPSYSASGDNHRSSGVVPKPVSTRTKQSGDRRKLRNHQHRHGANVLPSSATQRLAGKVDTDAKLRNDCWAKLREGWTCFHTGSPTPTPTPTAGTLPDSISGDVSGRLGYNFPQKILTLQPTPEKNKPSPKEQ